MCSIVDASVVGQLWDHGTSDAGKYFRRSIEERPDCRLVVGGKLRDELIDAGAIEWLVQLRLKGKLVSISDTVIKELTAELCQVLQGTSSAYISDDPHVIALARASGARLLFSNDKKLQQDFGNKALISGPRGRVYSTIVRRDVAPSHTRLIARYGRCT